MGDDAPGRAPGRTVWLGLAVVVVLAGALLVALLPSVRDTVLGAPSRPVVATAVDGPRPLVVVAGPDATLRTVDPATGDVLATFRTPEVVVRALTTVTVDGRPQIATGGDDGALRLYDLATGEPLGEVGDHGGPVTGLVAVRLPYPGQTVARPEPYDGGPGLASAGEDGTVRTWDASGRADTVARVPDGPVPDGDADDLGDTGGAVRALAADTRLVEQTYGAYQESLGTTVQTDVVAGTADGVVRPTGGYDPGRAPSAGGGVTALSVVRPPQSAIPKYGDPREIRLFAVGYGDGSIHVLTEISYSEQLPMTFPRDVARGPVTSLQTVRLPGGDAVVAGWRDGTVVRTGPLLAGGPVERTTLPAGERGGYALATAVVGGKPVVVAAFADGSVTRWEPDR